MTAQLTFIEKNKTTAEKHEARNGCLKYMTV